MDKILTLVRGIPGSGKTTFANSMAGSYPVYSADNFFETEAGYKFDASKLFIAHKQCQRKTEDSMKSETEKIYVANTFTKDSEMKDYFTLAEKYGYKVFSIIVENRHGNTNVHGVPSETLEAMRGRFSVKL